MFLMNYLFGGYMFPLKKSMPEWLIFEKYVLALLNELAKLENKELYVDYNDLKISRYTLDAYAPQGLNDIDGPLAIEIKYYSSLSSRFNETIIKLSQDLNSDIKIFLLITNIKVKNELFIEYPNIVVWDGTKIKEIARKFPEVSFQYSDFNIPGFLDFKKKKKRNELIHDTVSKYETTPINVHKNNHVKKLMNAYNHDDLVLCLGAGVSVGECLPNWEKLIKSLLKELLTSHNKNIKNLDNELNDNYESFSNITLARFIKKGFKSQFHGKLRNCLYEGYSSILNSESLLNNIAELCRPVRDKVGIYAIVTYNYDDLLEFYLEEKGIKHTIIYREYDVMERDSLPIYHVHGFLPQKGRLKKDIKKSILFAEEEYHFQYETPFSWQNLTQLNLFKEKTVLFIGMSGTDPNLRRLLDIAKAYSKGNANHYAILKNRWDLTNKKLANIFRNIEEDVFKELGINVIWYNDPSEINLIIKEIGN